MSVHGAEGAPTESEGLLVVRMWRHKGALLVEIRRSSGSIHWWPKQQANQGNEEENQGGYTNNINDG